MATTLQGRYPFMSAFGMRQRIAGQYGLLRKELASTGYKTYAPWRDFYLEGFTITAHTLDLDDTLGGGGSGNNIFIMSE